MSNRILPLALAATIAAAAQASAQTPAAGAQAATPSPNKAALDAIQANPTGPIIPGLCIVQRERVMVTSTVGRYVGTRMQAIESQVNTELNTARTQAQTDARALEGQRATLGEAAFNAQAQALAQRFEALYNIRIREVEATQQLAEQRILQEMTPIIIDVFRDKRCSVMLDHNSVIMRADASDMTNEVLNRLNAKITQFPLEKVQAPAQAAAPAGAAPAAGAATTPARPAQGPSR